MSLFFYCRIKSLEHPVVSNLFNQYLPQSNSQSIGNSCTSTPLIEKVLAEVLTLRGQVTVLQELVMVTAEPQPSSNTQSNSDNQSRTEPEPQPSSYQASSEHQPSGEQQASSEHQPTAEPQPSAEPQARSEPQPSTGPQPSSDTLPRIDPQPNVVPVAPPTRHLKAKKDKKINQPFKPFKATSVTIQPWLSSTVWDHGPTISISKEPVQHDKTTKTRSATKNQKSHSHSRKDGPGLGRGSSRHASADLHAQNRSQAHAAAPDQSSLNANAAPLPSQPAEVVTPPGQAATQASQHSNSSPLLGGSRNIGPVLDNVRSSWSARFPQSSNPPQQPSCPNGTQQAGPVLDTVRSAWASRFPQANSQSQSDLKNNQYLN